MRQAGSMKSFYVPEEQPTKRAQQSKPLENRKPEDWTRRVQKHMRTGEPRRSDDMVQEFSADEQLSKQKKQAATSTRRSRTRPQAAKKSDENLSMRRNMRSTKMPYPTESTRRKTSRHGNHGMTLSERAAKKLKYLGSKPIERNALTAAVEKAKKQQHSKKSKRRPSRAFIAGEDKPQRRKRSHRTKLDSSPYCLSPQVSSQSPLCLPFVPNATMTQPPRRQVRPSIPLKPNSTANQKSIYVENELRDPEDKLTPEVGDSDDQQKAEDGEDAKEQTNTDSQNFENVPENTLLVPYNGDMVPYWTFLKYKQPEDEPADQIPYDDEAVLLVNTGQLKLEPMPNIQIILSSDLEFEDLEKRNLLIFRKEIIFGNTVRTIIGLNDKNFGDVPEPEDNGKKVSFMPEPNTQALYKRDNYKIPFETISFKPSPYCYGYHYKMAKKMPPPPSF